PTSSRKGQPSWAPARWAMPSSPRWRSSRSSGAVQPLAHLGRTRRVTRRAGARAQDVLVIIVLVLDIDLVVVAQREHHVAVDHIALGALARSLHPDLIALALLVENGADAEARLDLFRGDLHHCRFRIAAVALAGDLLRVGADDRK